MFKEFFAIFRSGTRSLKTQLAIYFIPITILPAIGISVYAMRTFQETANDGLSRRASSERDAIVAEIDSFETESVEALRKHASQSALVSAVRTQDPDQIFEAVSNINPRVRVRVYSADGQFLVRRPGEDGDPQIAYISKEGIRRVRTQNETFDRYFSNDRQGFVSVIRSLVKDRTAVLGILEEEVPFGNKELSELKNRRQLDVVFLSRDFTSSVSSFPVPESELKVFSSQTYQPGSPGKKDPVFIHLAGSRYAAFLYDFPAHFGKIKYWGYVAVFLSMTSVDATTGRLKVNLVLITAFLILSFALLNFLFSNRIVKPIEMLVYAMKRVKTGRVEQIPPIESAYEIEYMVRAFNEMTRNVSAAKRALELKLEELHNANQEIKNTQSTLVQSAKMISLGQIVAGVAHELNNPIGFIYSNMHHLSEYSDKFRQLVEEYRSLKKTMPKEAQKHADEIEKKLEVDFLLKDMQDLTRSCVDGAKRTKDIVLGLRTFSRMDESSFRPEDIHEGIRSTLRLLAAELKNKITVHEEYGSLPLVECTLSQINQVFMNLLTNSAHAMDGRGDIWIRTRPQNENVVIEIEDNGSGMSPQTLEKIFDPFFTTKKVGQGTGLGLSIAYGLIQKHHGTIKVKSVIGHGTVFTITLPLRQPVVLAS